jgi:hypothetical protein
MTKVIRIEPTGEIIHVDGGAIGLADIAFDGDVDVVTCTSPLLPPGVYVGAIDDWGLAKNLPVNMKAWALYNRSPIFGPMYFADDNGADLPDDVLAMLAEPIESWMPATQLDTMTHIIAIHYPEAVAEP